MKNWRDSMYKATSKDIDLIRKILMEELNKNNIEISQKDISSLVSKVLDTSYSIGGGYEESAIRKIVSSMIQRNML
jgi:hypothetical protein